MSCDTAISDDLYRYLLHLTLQPDQEERSLLTLANLIGQESLDRILAAPECVDSFVMHLLYNAKITERHIKDIVNCLKEMFPDLT